MDLIRGASALLVCAGHLRNVLFVDYAEAGSNGVFTQAFYFLTGLGHEAVMIFFVLSGFFVGGSVLKRRETFASSPYLIARLSRLWTPLIPALLLTFGVDLLIGWWHPEMLTGAYQSVMSSGPTAEYSASPLTFLGNVFFLQTIITPVFGTNSPLWSLAYEFWFYLLFPLLGYLLGFVRAQLVPRTVAGLALAGSLFLLPGELLHGFLIWALGVVVYLVFQQPGKRLPLAVLLVGIVSFGAAIINSSFGVLPQYYPWQKDLLIGVGFTLTLLGLKGREFPVSTSRLYQTYEKLAFWLSDISYTLYIFHFPLLLLIYLGGYQEQQLMLSVPALLQFTGWLLLLVGLSRIAWWLFEKRTGQVRKVLTQVMGPKRHSSRTAG